MNLVSYSDLLDGSSESKQAIIDLVHRLELLPTILRRQQEEYIASLVTVDAATIDAKCQSLLGDSSLEQFLEKHNWSHADLKVNAKLPEALKLFSEQYFGPGVEEYFLSSRGTFDEVIYSVIRVRDQSVAQELWIRLEEKESSFSELASSFGEGREAAHHGLIGPLKVGQIHPPQLADVLRTLTPGQVCPPRQMGEWSVLLRLEKLTPARFDPSMREFLLKRQLDSLLDNRVQDLLSGNPLTDLHYHN